MYLQHTTVQLHHTDAFGIIFFANQFILAHSCFQSWLEEVGLQFPPNRQLATELLVIVRAESDYLAPIQLSDRLAIAFQVERIGTSSVTNVFTLTNQHGVSVGRVRTVHVLIHPVTSAKMTLPVRWRTALNANLIGPSPTGS